MKYFILLLTIVMVSCHSHEHDEEGGHNHEGHDHAADGSHDDHDDHDEEIPSAQITAWSDNIEIFVDMTSLVAGESSTLATHATFIEKHQPVLLGTMVISVRDKTGEVIASIDAHEPNGPGIFVSQLQIENAGLYQIEFHLTSGDLDERVIVDNIRVHASKEDAHHAADSHESEGTEISFLKEQAWLIDFATRQAVMGEIYNVVNSSGVWKTAPGATKSIVATVAGIVEFRSNKLTDGGDVFKGQHLMSISSDQLTSENVGVEVEQARSVYLQAEAAYNRKKELYESQIIPKSEFEVVESRYAIAKSHYESLVRGYSSGVKVITAPFTGYIKAVNVENGDFVREGSKLITMATDRSKILESHVSPTYAVSEKDIRNIWYQPRPGAWSSLNEAGGTLLSVSEQVSADHPMAAVFAQVNEEVKMPAGGFSEVQIALGDVSPGIIIPESALLEDYGNFSVVVQLSGESFIRRPVRVGRRNGNMVEITSGLAEGEWVVTVGAYQVKMASMSGELPAHGHSH